MYFNWIIKFLYSYNWFFMIYDFNGFASFHHRYFMKNQKLWKEWKYLFDMFIKKMLSIWKGQEYSERNPSQDRSQNSIVNLYSFNFTIPEISAQL